jgi:hypothetical protein
MTIRFWFRKLFPRPAARRAPQGSRRNGLGARSFNVGLYGAAVGVPNGGTRNVYQLLEAVNSQAVDGLLYNGNAGLRRQAYALFEDLNEAGTTGHPG